jgi:hypothetical protein
MQPHLRASDADRDHTIHVLQHHTAAGRLTLDEFTTRADAVCHATTHGDLAAVTADLPPEPVHRRTPPRVPVLAAALLGAVLLVVLLGAAAAVAGPAGWDHMHAMMTSMSTVMGGGCGPQPASP